MFVSGNSRCEIGLDSWFDIVGYTFLTVLVARQAVLVVGKSVQRRERGLRWGGGGGEPVGGGSWGGGGT